MWRFFLIRLQAHFVWLKGAQHFFKASRKVNEEELEKRRRFCRFPFMRSVRIRELYRIRRLSGSKEYTRASVSLK